MLNAIMQAQVQSVLPMWAGSGGKGEYRDWFIETVYKAVKANPRYTVLLEEIASGSTVGEPDAVISDSHSLKSAGPKAETRPSAESQDPPAEESAQPKAAANGDLVPAAEVGRAALVDDFLVTCNRESGLEVELVRKHISLAVGHKYPRQFQYWQSCDPRTTAADNRNFGRILRMTPTEFVKVLREKRAI